MFINFFFLISYLNNIGNNKILNKYYKNMNRDFSRRDNSHDMNKSRSRNQLNRFFLCVNCNKHDVPTENFCYEEKRNIFQYENT